ncbi:MAG: nitronate monooxygenase [Alphaproteobacteria bacterium]|nr:nitronate monooxygenase [Alphaproteobacteria bacterium]
MNGALHTRVCDLFGIRYPIVQTGMGWVAGANLVAATSEAGGLGILAAATMTLPQLQEAIARVKARTSKPFGVNLRADQDDVDALIALIIREEVKVASFARAPGPDAIRRFKDAGVLTMPTVGARRHAEKVAAWGVDAVIAQGGEGGGHTGSVATSLLVPDVADAVDIPVLAAGGFRDGRGLVAALAWGADGIAMGTRFLLTAESHVPDAVKQTYLGTPLDGTVVTTAVDGYPQRVVRTPFIDQLERGSWPSRLVAALRHALALRDMTGTSLVQLLREGRRMRTHGDLSWPQVAMAANAPLYTRAALVDGRVDAGVLPTGQVVGAIRELPTVAQLVDGIIAEAEATLARLSPGAVRPSAVAEEVG